MSMDNPPVLHHRKSSGTAYIYYRGKQIYMGKWGREADHNYERWLSGWLAHNKRGVEITNEKYTVPMLIAEYLEFYEGRANRSKSDYAKIVSLAKRICKIFPETYVDDFGPKSLKFLRDDLVQNGYFRDIAHGGETRSEHRMYSRKYVNKLINFTRSMFKWGVSEEIVDNATYVALTTILPLFEGDANTYEPAPRETVSEQDFLAVMKYLRPFYQDYATIMRLTAMRPSELRLMTVEDINTGSEVWLYTPKTHKMKSRGKQRVVPFGPKSIKIIKERIKGKKPNDYVFSIGDLYDDKKKNRPKKYLPGASQPMGDQAFREAIKRAIKLANNNGEHLDAKNWTPYCLRHTAITAIELQEGPVAGQRLAGHSSLQTTQIYSHAALAEAIQIAKKYG